jgi:hypothetical protein
MLEFIYGYISGLISGIFITILAYIFYNYKYSDINNINKYLLINASKLFITHAYDSYENTITPFLSIYNQNKEIIDIEIIQKIKPLLSNTDKMAKHIEWYINYNKTHNNPFIFTIGIGNDGPLFNLTLKDESIIENEDFKDMLRTMQTIKIPYVIN